MADGGVSAAAAGSTPYPNAPPGPVGAGGAGVKELTGLVAYHLWCDAVKKLGKRATIQQRQAWFNERLWSEYNARPLVASLTQVYKVHIHGADEPPAARGSC